MKKQRYICRKCGYTFEVEVIEREEAEEKGIPIGPVRCPKCKSADVERK